jgi:[ribosomal protein S5]-alanine N-acetyltransferase
LFPERSRALTFLQRVAGSSRQRLMIEVVRGAVRRAFDEFGLHRLEANILRDNHASVAPVRGLGFQNKGFAPRYLHIDGEFQDYDQWALLSDGASIRY